MSKKLFFIFLFLQCKLFGGIDDFESYESFHITRDVYYRLWHITSDDVDLGTIVNSNWGVLDFYDFQDNKMCVNIEDELFDLEGNCIATSYVVSDHERHPDCWWFEENDYCGSKRIDISHKDKLFYLQQEGNVIDYRDAETDQPIAVAFSGTKLVKKGYLFNSYANYWEIIFIDSARLQEKQIPKLYLLWTLMKHNQKNMAGPVRLPYVTDYPNGVKS